jgi:beta-galactosidase
MRTKLWLAILLCITVIDVQADVQPVFSTAGFFSLPNTGRLVYSMNPGWRFHKGHVENAQNVSFNDANWDKVNLPNPIDTLPADASGCINYQGEVWYRKHFRISNEWKGKNISLYFEGIMGKSRIWINGTLIKSHYGGFLPVISDVSSLLKPDIDNIITVCADNSDDPLYPPGKPENSLDYAYFGGIYRDCWLVVHNDVFITDPNYENQIAGGGLFVTFNKVSAKYAEINITTQLRNNTLTAFKGQVYYELYDSQGKRVWHSNVPANILNDSVTTVSALCKLKNPYLWSPDAPNLYKLHLYVKDHKNKIIDGYYQRIGIKSIEFKGEQGFWLNGKPYPTPLIGANRHQDFAVVGNSLSNSLHWRDAKKLRDVGMKVIRNAHYPQDPAFMDACDELGLFVIVNTPGWQFWNKAPIFASRVYNDIRNMVRRDRNHASVWLWEPILNETNYPDDFAQNANDIVHAEYPCSNCYTGCDKTARGNKNFPILFTHPSTGGDAANNKGPDVSAQKDINYFTREWGDNVDDWSSHNSPSRASRAWGEMPMLVQADGYACPSYKFTCLETLYQTSRQHVGGCLWHSFDHQRGYHPDPFYGGIMDAFRQPKYSYYMFKAQRPVTIDTTRLFETGPMIYIANAMTPFSPADVTIYSNCDSVVLAAGINNRTYTYKKSLNRLGMPSPIITFKDVFHVMDDKELSRRGKQSDSYLLANGYVNGKLVSTDKVMPARRPTRIKLTVDNEKMEMKADGSDMVTVIASIVDNNGCIKRLNNNFITFEVYGEGTIVADSKSMTNPGPVRWGTAPVIVRSTTVPGVIHLKASVLWEGQNTPLSDEIDIKTYPVDYPMIYKASDLP